MLGDTQTSLDQNKSLGEAAGGQLKTKIDPIARQIALLSRPDTYAEERLGMKLHPKQKAVLRDLFSREGSRVVNRCSNEVGKTRKIACAAILYAIEIRGAVVVSTAGTFRQVEGQLLPALNSYAHLFDTKLWDFQKTSIKRFDTKNQLWTDAYTGISTDNEHYFQGYHKDEGRPLLIIIDECQGVSVEICRAAEDRCNPTWFLATGSPGDPQGAFYDMETANAKHYTHHKLTRLECLREDGWWLDRADIQRLIEKYGEDNPFVQSTVFGNFSLIVEGALLSLSEYDRCLENPPLLRDGDQHAFCDYAAGRAKNVFAHRRGNRVQIVRKWFDRDTMSAVGQFLACYIKAKQDHGLDADKISGDADGLGLPMIHRTKEVGWNINEFHGNAEPRFERGYKNAIAEAWGETARKIKECSIILPPDLDLKAQLLGRKCKRNSSGLLELESKEDMKKRGVDSPDEADAVCVACMPAPITKSFSLLNNIKEFQQQSEYEDTEQQTTGQQRRFFQ